VSDFEIPFSKSETKIKIMKKNMGAIDKIIRITVAVTIAILFFTGIVPGVTGIILMSLAGVFLLTSFIGTCPLYLPFGISTRNKN